MWVHERQGTVQSKGRSSVYVCMRDTGIDKVKGRLTVFVCMRDRDSPKQREVICICVHGRQGKSQHTYFGTKNSWFLKSDVHFKRHGVPSKGGIIRACLQSQKVG